MVASVLAFVAFIAVISLIAGFASPVLAVPVLLLALAPLAVMAAGRMFKHAAPSATSGASATKSGPAVPSTRDAAYEPVENPRQRA